MKIRFYNARILTMEKDSHIHTGELWVENGIISYIGSREDAENREKPEWDREIDARGNLLMPGFKNAHTHSAMTFLRSYADDLPLQDWLFQRVFPMEAKLKPEDVKSASKLAIMEYLTSGITANFDMYFFPEQFIEASIECGFRTVMCGQVSGTDEEAEDILNRLTGYYNTFNNKHPLISCRLGFHAEYTTGRKVMEGIAELAQKYQAPVFTHNAETKKEVDECIARYGMTPTMLMDYMGMFMYGGGGFHCVWLNEEDIEIFKKHDMSIVTNPGSNTKLASGIAPLTHFLDNGINVAIGTDGPASNNCLDMFREMFLATGLQKLQNSDAAAMDAMDVLRMATVGGAKAMGLKNCDVLAQGKAADLIMIDLHQPNMQPLNFIEKNIVYSGSKQNVKMTMVNGKILYEDGEFFIGEDPERIYADVNELIARCKEV